MTKIKQAVILAGGRGERLRPITDAIPKPMVPVNGLPFLDYLINSLMLIGIEKILLLVGYKHELIIQRYGSSLNGKIKIEYSIGSVSDQTGRRLLNAFSMLDQKFMLLYGDNYWPIEFDKMMDLYDKKGVKIMTTVFNNINGTAEYGYENNIEVSSDNYVIRYDKTRKSFGLNGVDMGYFVIDKDCLNPCQAGNLSFEEDILPQAIIDRQLIAYMTGTQYYYITNISSLKKFETIVSRNYIKPIIKSVVSNA